MIGWRQTTLGEIVTLQRGHDLTEEQRTPGSIPVIGSAGQNGWHDVARAEGPGVAVGRSGASAGVVTYVREAFWPHNTALYVRDFKGNDPLFVANLLRTLPLAELNSGSAQPSLNRNFLYPIPVLVPPPDEQRRIASILGTYDDLIEVNRRRVALLEDMSRGLFEEWFIRFRFPGHEAVALVDTADGPVPEGWRIAPLTEAVEIAYGFPFKSRGFTNIPGGTRVVRIRDVPGGRTSTWTPEAFDPKYDVADGDLLVGMDGIFHTAVWVGGAAALNQRVARLRPLQGRSVSWALHSTLPKIQFFEATISGTTVAHLGAKHLNSIRVRIASPTIQAAADKFLSPIDRQLVGLRRANESLAASRDLLLPRLISGKLSVAAAERELQEAA